MMSMTCHSGYIFFNLKALLMWQRVVASHIFVQFVQYRFHTVTVVDQCNRLWSPPSCSGPPAIAWIACPVEHLWLLNPFKLTYKILVHALSHLVEET